MLRSLLCIASLAAVEAHGHMVEPLPKQPEALYWYQVGCAIGCTCTGGGKENYPSLSSLDCAKPATPRLPTSAITFNAENTSPRGAWNQFMPWRAPGTSQPLDSCGIASGFLPTAKVQYPHKFAAPSIVQGMKGTALPYGTAATWRPGATVNASFTLIVNHGGGYQYRVCKLEDESTAVSEACFEESPLKFADTKHTVRFSDTAGGGEVEIDAVDVTQGVHPAGYAWRRLPLPACNCDSGYGCSPNGTKVGGGDFAAAYTSTGKPYGACPTGLQFAPGHLADGTWPGGYGYYVGDITRTSGPGGAKASGGGYDKTEGSSTGGATKGAGASSGASATCSTAQSEAACKAASSDCKWHASAAKTVCYYADPNSGGSKGRRLQDFSGATGTYTEMPPNWVLVDRLVAPVVEGRYVLQWRWDNDQTPQIWTTCADVVVAAERVQWWWIAVSVLAVGLAVVAVVVVCRAIKRSRAKAAPAA